ncbi:carboxypeptidase regulatory-like domain-containing protein [Geodermatophilus africanus]|uniref:carboxypeptidase regulatory-like domain-containing protein n=1 Tax=Geodermatophilus africanus TaxID=1137993 RepID=UPI0011148BBD
MAVGPRGELTGRIGRVVDADGDVVPNALVAVVAAAVPMPEIGLRCDDQGRFFLRLPPGSVTLRAHSRQGNGEVEIQGQSADEILIVVRP